MTKNSLLPFFAIAALAQSPAKVGSPSADLMIGREILDCGVSVSFRINYEPWPPSNGAFDTALMGSDPVVGGNTLRHYICNMNARSCLGVEMQVSGTPSNMHVSFGPIPMTAAFRESLDAAAGGRPLNFVRLSKYPPPQTVRVGDTLAIDLMTSADGRDRIVEYFKFSSAPEPRDATIDDGSFFSLDFRAGPEIRIDGRTVVKTASLSTGQAGGSTLWLYVPGEGRYILSLSPHEGFTKGGQLRGGAAAFRGGGHEYELRGLLYPQLLSDDVVFNLYVFRDSGWAPSTSTDSITGGIGRLTDLLPRQ
jgi:hypothetical protein